MSEKRFVVKEEERSYDFNVIDLEMKEAMLDMDFHPFKFRQMAKADKIAAVMNHLHDDYQGKIAKLEQRIEYLENKLGVGIE